MKKYILIFMLCCILFSGCESYRLENIDADNNFECNSYCNSVDYIWFCEYYDIEYYDVKQTENGTIYLDDIICNCNYYNCLIEIKE